ncbi:MAG: hypothetical protein K1X29_07305 [Bdellovibrionales bacterium]|nr:hypothetical protein [Bdellovibrionales bacterium]
MSKLFYIRNKHKDLISHLLNLKFLTVLSTISLFGYSVYAIDIDGKGALPGVQALYSFKDYQSPSSSYTNNFVPDLSGSSVPLNLEVDNPSHFILSTDENGKVGLTFKSVSVLRSKLAATRIVQSCSASNEITIEAWIRNLSEEPVGRQQPVRIVALGKKNLVSNKPVSHTDLIYIGQKYDGLGLYSGALNLSSMINFNSLGSPGTLLFGSKMPAQRVVYTKDKSGVSRFWLSNSSNTLILQQETINSSSLSIWNSDPDKDKYYLSIGNEPFYSEFPEYDAGPVPGKEWKSWLGTIYSLAIYCQALTRKDLLGDLDPGSTLLATYPVNLNAPITPELERAQTIFKRITGIKTPIDNPILQKMADKIKEEKADEAALLATDDSSFYNITVRDMAARMSTRDETTNTPLNDLVATIIGVARDDLPATDLLTGNYSYRGDPKLTAVPNDEIKDFLLSNNHYQYLEQGRYDLKKVLMKVVGQKLYNGSTGSVVPNPDTAGVITSRAFMAAHAVAGTNRRLVEYTFREFLCIPINQWADTSGTDTFVGRDVDRAPGGIHEKYKTTCRSCHSVMDSFRGAFAKVDFSANYVKNADVLYGLSSANENDNTSPLILFQNPIGIAGKMNRNNTTFPEGNAVESTAWVNNANQGLNASYFGWPELSKNQSTHQGYGINSFATLVSQSKAFPRCMAIRAFRSVCKRDPGSLKDEKESQSEKDFISDIAAGFSSTGYKLKYLFSKVAASEKCLGK